MAEKKFKQKRAGWYRAFKALTRGRYKKPEFVYLGDRVTMNAIILSNHEGTDAPMTMEHHADFPVRFWGAYEMNSGLRKMYKYQSEVYYHQKKGWSLFGARLFCLLASPLTNIYYKGLKLISTYRDSRFRKTIKESADAMKNGENIVIFPEKSENGYQAELQGFYAGFVLLAEKMLKDGVDVNIYTAYLKKKERKYIIDKPMKYSEVKARFSTRAEIAEYFLERCNDLGRIEFPKVVKVKKKKKDKKN